MGIIGKLAGLIRTGEPAALDWQVLIEIDGVTRAVTLPGCLGAAWAGSPIGSEDFERASAEVHRRIALARSAARSAVPRPLMLAAG